MLMSIVRSPMFHAIVTGIATAAAVDVHVFLGFKKIEEASTYDWRTALLRWTQGAVYGALAGLGFKVF